jgi:hypothetical protein
MKSLKLQVTVGLNEIDSQQVHLKEFCEYMSLMARSFLRTKGAFTPGTLVLVTPDEVREGQ